MNTIDITPEVISVENISISGSGGGKKSGGGKGRGKSQRAPSESANTLESRSQLNILYLLGEGEIVGVDNLYQSVYLDDTPIQNPDGSFNYQNVKLFFRPGTLTQDYIPGFSSNENETPVGLQVRKNQGAITRTITNNQANSVRVRVMVPSLQKVETDTGDIKPTSVSFKIEVAVLGGGFVERVRDTISGKTTTPYERFYRISLPGSPTGQWQIRVTRLTDDSQEQRLQNDLVWQSLTTIIDAKLKYPYSALLAMRIDAEQFQSLPRLSIKLKGKKVLMPTNYDPVTRAYQGVWNGTFKYGYTNNPAWVLYDMLINERYGAGKWVNTSLIDKWFLYGIAQYCDQQVPNGKGGSEPRFTFNGYMFESSDAWELLSRIAASFRAAIIWTGGSIQVKQDRPENPVKMFTKANVVQEVDEESGQVVTPAFNYSSSGKAARHTSAIVSYNNPDMLYTQDSEYVENYDAISRYGYNPVNVDLLGCTSIGQARRMGLWTVLTEYYLTQTVTFRTGLQGAHLSILDVIEISDPLKTIVRQSGRVAALYEVQNHFYLDTPDYGITTVSPGDFISFQTFPNQIAEGRVGAVYYNHNNTGLTLIGLDQNPTGQQPFVNGVWMIKQPALKPAKFRVLTAVDRTDSDTLPHYEITALQYNNSLYNAVDYGADVEIPPTASLPPTTPNRPANLNVEVSALLREASWQFNIKVAWERPTYFAVPDPYTSGYQVQIRHGTHGQWLHTIDTPSLYAEYPGVNEDVYYVRVRAKDILNRWSGWVESVQIICRKPLPPNPIGDIRKELRADNSIYLSWSDTQNYRYGIVGYNIWIKEGLNGIPSLFQQVPAGTFYSNPINKPPGVYYVEIYPVDRTNQQSESGLKIIIGSEFAPPNPSGTITAEIDDLGNMRLYWLDDTTKYPDSFQGYRVYKTINGVTTLMQQSLNMFTDTFSHPDDTGATYNIKAYNTMGFESLGSLQASFAAMAIATTVPVPLGSITKVQASDGGILLRWTDTQLYDPKKFAGYRIYINGKLTGASEVKEHYSVQFDPKTAPHKVVIKAYFRSGLQSTVGLETEITKEDLLPPSPIFLLVDQNLEGTKIFYWDIPKNPPPDIKLFRLKFTTGSSLNWDTAHFLQDVLLEYKQFETSLFREGIYTVLVKTVDINGNESTNSSFTTINLGDPKPDNLIESWNFRLPAQSDPTSTAVAWQMGNYKLENMEYITDPETGKNALRQIEITQPAYYESSFEPTESGHLKVKVEARGNYRVDYKRETGGVLWNLATENDVFWVSENEPRPFWIAEENYLGFPVSIRVHQEAYKVRVYFSPGETQAYLTELVVFVDAPDIMTYHNNVVVSATTGVRVKPYKPMVALKNVNMALQDTGGTTARTLVIAQKDPVEGALIFAKDINNNNTTATIDVTLVGY
jgi:predicted phage tail protein